MDSQISGSIYYLNSCIFETGVEVVDNTSGIVKVNEDEKNKGYLITVYNKKIVYPYPSSSELQIAFFDTRRITVDRDIQKRNIIKICITSVNNTNVFYVNIHSNLVEGEAFCCYNYIPTLVTRDVIDLKILSLIHHHAFLTPEIIVFNTHGIATCVWNSVKRKYALYYASPQDSVMKYVKANFTGQKNLKGSFIAKSECGFVCLSYITTNADDIYYLNGEIASTPYFLTKKNALVKSIRFTENF